MNSSRGGARKAPVIALSLIGAARLLMHPASARAGDAGAEIVELAYSAPGECPARAALVREVLARTQVARVRDVSEGQGQAGEALRRFDVALEGTEKRFAAKLVLRDQKEDHESVRYVTGSDCMEVVSALGLMIALAVDPNANAGPDAPPPTGSSTPPRNEGESPDTRGQGASHDSKTIATARPIQDVQDANGATQAGRTGRGARERGDAHWELLSGLQAYSLFMGGPTPAWGAVVSGEIRWHTSSVWAPSVRASLWGATASSGPLGDGAADGESSSARFVWGVARVEACPIHIRLLPALGAIPCLGLDRGLLWAKTNGMPDARSTTRPWFTSHAVWRLVGHLGDRLQFELQGGGLLAIAADTYVLTAPRTEVFRVQRVGGFAGLGLAYLW